MRGALVSRPLPRPGRYAPAKPRTKSARSAARMPQRGGSPVRVSSTLTSSALISQAAQTGTKGTSTRKHRQRERGSSRGNARVWPNSVDYGDCSGYGLLRRTSSLQRHQQRPEPCPERLPGGRFRFWELLEHLRFAHAHEAGFGFPALECSSQGLPCRLVRLG